MLQFYNTPINEYQAKLVLKPLTPEWKWKLIYEPIHHDVRILSKKIPITKFLNLQVWWCLTASLFMKWLLSLSWSVQKMFLKFNKSGIFYVLVCIDSHCIAIDAIISWSSTFHKISFVVVYSDINGAGWCRTQFSNACYWLEMEAHHVFGWRWCIPDSK